MVAALKNETKKNNGEAQSMKHWLKKEELKENGYFNKEDGDAEWPHFPDGVPKVRLARQGRLRLR